jgi:hypothetical protein
MTTAIQKFKKANEAWHNEFVRIWGESADAFAYTSYARGEENSELRRLFDLRAAAHNEWLEENNLTRAR